MPRGPRRGSKKKPRLSRGFKMTLQRDPTHRHHSEPDNLFAIRQQSRIGRNHGAAKLHHQAAVEIELESPVFWFTRQVRHNRLARSRIRC